jgi:ATP-dependent RNA helicase DDX52/ROK1
MISNNYKFSHPTPIQSSVIPILKEKKNIIASSETGSGKTLSYLIPIIHNSYVNKIKSLDQNKAIIILPTKELCKQIYNEALIFSNYYSSNKVKVKYVNKSMLESARTNFENFLENNDIFLATPKTALDLLQLENKILTEKLLYLILDEADKFFDLGFIEIVDEILYELKDKHQTVKGFFSATLVPEIEEIITTHILNSIKISIGSSRAPARSINQKFIYCTSEEGKIIGIRNLFKDGFEPPMLIFVEGIHKLQYLYDQIKFDMPKTSFLHSKMSKQEREDVVKKFRLGEIWILMCTDLLARGIDFKNVKTVLNFDCPYNPVNYIHKIGRTGRAGKSGKAFTFVIDDDISKLRNLSKMLGDSQGKIECPNWILNLNKKE